MGGIARQVNGLWTRIRGVLQIGHSELASGTRTTPGVSYRHPGAPGESVHSVDQIPLFPDPSDHQAFVRYVGLPWPMVGTAYAVTCPGCPDLGAALFADYDAARDVALSHRIDEHAWIPRDEMPFGPREKWGPSGASKGL